MTERQSALYWMLEPYFAPSSLAPHGALYQSTPWLESSDADAECDQHAREPDEVDQWWDEQRARKDREDDRRVEQPEHPPSEVVG